MPSHLTSEILRFVKADLINIMKNEYLRLGSAMKDCAFMEIVRKVEIEMSKNQQFELLILSNLGNVWYVFSCSMYYVYF